MISEDVIDLQPAGLDDLFIQYAKKDIFKANLIGGHGPRFQLNGEMPDTIIEQLPNSL